MKISMYVNYYGESGVKVVVATLPYYYSEAGKELEKEKAGERQG